MKDHAQFLILLFVLIGLVLFATHFIKQSNPGEAPDVSNNQPQESTTTASNDVSQPEENEHQEPQEEQEEDIVIPFDREGVVTISNISRGYGDRPTRIKLNSNLKEGEVLNITDWKIRTNSSWFLIPEAVNNYQINEPNEEEPLIIKKDQAVYIYLGVRSPVGDNFRINNCIGYLNNKKDFYYSLPNNCPLPEKEDYKHLSGECQDIIRGFRRCELPDANEMNSLRFPDSNECRQFIYNFFNVKNCYDYYNNETDLLNNEWWLWVNREDILDPQHDWVRIENSQDKVIDEYSY